MGRGRESWNGVEKLRFWKDLTASYYTRTCDVSLLCHGQVLAALLEPLMRTPDTVNHDTFCCALGACEMNFLLIIKCSPTCGKLPFLGPFKSNLMQSSFPHATEQGRPAVITRHSALAAWLLREIVPSAMNFNISCQPTTRSQFSNFCQITAINILK